MEYELFGLEIASITSLAVAVIVIFLFQAFFIWFGAKVAHIKNASFGKAFGAAIGIAVLGFIIATIFSLVTIANSEIISIVITFLAIIWVIKSVFNTNWGKALIAWVISVIGAIIAVIVIAYLLDVSFVINYSI